MNTMEMTNTQLEPVTKVLAATAVSQSFSFCMERKYLQNIESGDLFMLDPSPSVPQTNVAWIAIKQIGRPLGDASESCFSAIQKILYACFLPQEMQLLFLVVGNNRENHLYLGLRAIGKANPPKSMVRNLNEFLKGIWPGLDTAIVSSFLALASSTRRSFGTDWILERKSFTCCSTAPFRAFAL